MENTPTDPTPALEHFGAEFQAKITAYIQKIDDLATEYNLHPIPGWMLHAMSPKISKIARVQDKYGYYWTDTNGVTDNTQIDVTKGFVDNEDAAGWKKHCENMLADTDTRLDMPGYNVSTLMTFWLLHVKDVHPDILQTEFQKIVQNVKLSKGNDLCKHSHDAWALGTLYQLTGACAGSDDWKDIKDGIMLTKLVKNSNVKAVESTLTAENILQWKIFEDATKNNKKGVRTPVSFVDIGFMLKEARHAEMMVEFDDLVDYTTRRLDPIMGGLVLKMSKDAVYKAVEISQTIGDYFAAAKAAASKAPADKDKEAKDKAAEAKKAGEANTAGEANPVGEANPAGEATAGGGINRVKKKTKKNGPTDKKVKRPKKKATL
jgi:hypothetical protein